jgi:hypothetical protein
MKIPEKYEEAFMIPLSKPLNLFMHRRSLNVFRVINQIKKSMMATMAKY